MVLYDLPLLILLQVDQTASFQSVRDGLFYHSHTPLSLSHSTHMLLYHSTTHTFLSTHTFIHQIKLPALVNLKWKEDGGQLTTPTQAPGGQ